MSVATRICCQRGKKTGCHLVRQAPQTHPPCNADFGSCREAAKHKKESTNNTCSPGRMGWGGAGSYLSAAITVPTGAMWSWGVEFCLMLKLVHIRKLCHCACPYSKPQQVFDRTHLLPSSSATLHEHNCFNAWSSSVIQRDPQIPFNGW